MKGWLFFMLCLSLSGILLAKKSGICKFYSNLDFFQISWTKNVPQFLQGSLFRTIEVIASNFNVELKIKIIIYKMKYLAIYIIQYTLFIYKYIFDCPNWGTLASMDIGSFMILTFCPSMISCGGLCRPLMNTFTVNEAP